MRRQDMEIKFDNPTATYHPGGTVGGELILTFETPKKVQEIAVKLKGETKVKWTVRSGRSNRDYKGHEKYFKEKIVVFHGSEDGTEIPSGTHSYNFLQTLPSTIPSSFQGKHGYIRYTAKAIVSRPWKFDKKHKSEFTVIVPRDLNDRPEAKRPIIKHGQEFFGLICRSGPLNVNVNIPASGFVPKQTIPVRIEIENFTDSNVTSVKCVLRKIVTFRVDSPRERIKTKETDEAEIERDSSSNLVRSGASEVIERKLEIPDLFCFSLQNCSYIGLRYEIKVQIGIDDLFRRSLKLHIPIMIGSTPFVQNFEPPFEELQPFAVRSYV